MRAWFLSGPLYMPICTLGCMTPTTVNVDWSICSVLPTAVLGRAEEILGQLVAEEDHPPLLLEVAVVQEAAAGLRKLVADLAEVGLHPADARVDGLRPHA